jgi:hypothetical protein
MPRPIVAAAAAMMSRTGVLWTGFFMAGLFYLFFALNLNYLYIKEKAQASTKRTAKKFPVSL